jgi:hypothetical protein
MVELASILVFLSDVAYVPRKNKSVMVQDMFVFEVRVYDAEMFFKVLHPVVL